MDHETIFRLVESSDFLRARALAFLVGFRASVLAWRNNVARGPNQLAAGGHLLFSCVVDCSGGGDNRTLEEQRRQSAGCRVSAFQFSREWRAPDSRFHCV